MFQILKKHFYCVICTGSDCKESWRLLLIRIPAVVSVSDLSPSHLSGRSSGWRKETIHSRWHFSFCGQPLEKIVISTYLMTIYNGSMILFIHVYSKHAAPNIFFRECNFLIWLIVFPQLSAQLILVSIFHVFHFIICTVLQNFITHITVRDYNMYCDLKY